MIQDPKLQLRVKPSVQLRVTPQLRASLAILQKPILDLRTVVDQALAENPFLEAESTPERELSLEQITQTLSEPLDEGFDKETDPSSIEMLQEKHDFLLSLHTAPVSLHEELFKQLHLEVCSPEDLHIGEAILDRLNSYGYLINPVEEIAKELGVAEEDVGRVLTAIQSFEPTGVGARNLKECLLIQLKARAREKSLAWRLVSDYFEDLGKRHFPQIAHRAGVSLEAVREAAKEIAALDPKPGSIFEMPARPIVPDLVVEKVDDDLEVECLNGYLPKLRVRTEYRSLLRSKTKDIHSDELKEKLQEAIGLVKALEDRRRTMEKLAEALLTEQAEFFKNGPGHLKSLTAKDLAKKLHLHESTVSRAVSNKYIATPFGLFPIKDLFAKKVLTADGKSHLKNQLREAVRGVIAQEDRSAPLTDQQIVEKLKTQGITVARRTVTKYKEKLKILPARLRK